MIIEILILSGIATLIIYFRRHGNGKLLQYGEGLKSLPVIEFDYKHE